MLKSYDYDLVLMLTAFQRNCIYASIIKELSAHYRIAVFPIELDDKTKSRISNTNRQFLELCKALGADVISSTQTFTAKIEILAQSNYRPEAIELIKTCIQAERTFWMVGVAMGNASYTNLYGKKIDKILVPDLRLYQHRIAEYGNDGVEFPASMIQEIGMPYKKYPLFEKTINVDYILANPTPFSFVVAQDRLDYLENVYGLVQKIATQGEVIAFKPHNADERADYIVDKNIHAVLAFPLTRPLHNAIDYLAKVIGRRLKPGRVRNLLTELSIAVVYRKVMSKVIKLSALTPYHNLNLETFLPTVRKGLITGRSNSIWHALYLKKPVWNCIDENKPYFSETKMHMYCMRYLGVHGNYDNAKFDEKRFDVIAESTREADIIQFLKSQLVPAESREYCAA